MQIHILNYIYYIYAFVCNKCVKTRSPIAARLLQLHDPKSSQ